MFRRSSLPVSRSVASPSSAYLFPDLFAARLCGKTARQSASRPNTAVRRPKVAKHCKISTYAKRVRNPRRISTSILKDLKLPRINTCRNKTIEQQNFHVPLLSSQARPARDLSTNTRANRARNSRRISTSVFKDLNLLRINTYRNKFWPPPRKIVRRSSSPDAGSGCILPQHRKHAIPGKKNEHGS